MIKRMLSLLLICVAIPAHAAPGLNTAHQAKGICSASLKVCEIMVKGFYEGSFMTAALIPPKKNTVNQVMNTVGYCPGDGVTISQMTAVFIQYLDEHPSELDGSAAMLAIQSWQKEWPCSK